MYKTKNDLPEGNRKKLIELLNSRLADCIDLQTQAKQAHWNVKGPSFIALHELFDDVAEGVEAHADLIAERAVQLGGVAEGTAMVIAQRSMLNEYPLTDCRWKGPRRGPLHGDRSIRQSCSKSCRPVRRTARYRHC